MTSKELNGLLLASHHLKPEPELQFEPDGQANYGLTLRVIQSIKQSGVSGFGFVGNERYGSFSRSGS